MNVVGNSERLAVHVELPKRDGVTREKEEVSSSTKCAR